jgi:crotonobetainyl-CoA:carnitine CoA-transferase CaiB-like acyl-CoA transferase
MTATPQTAGPLHGVRVLDLSRWIAGPLCTMLLADMGADVVKVERPSGDEVRRLQPRVGTESAYALHYNRNKRAITLDTRHEDAKDVLRRLVGWADVLVENYRPGTLEAMGLGPDVLEQLNPGLVVMSISGFGQTGPWRHRPLFNSIAEATAGAMSLTGSAESGPLMSGTFMADHTTGLYAAFATVTALYERARSGHGQRADVALFDSVVSVLGYSFTAALNGHQPPAPAGNLDRTAAPGNCYPTADGRFVYIDAGTDQLFGDLADAMGSAPDVRERFATGKVRMECVEELDELIERWTVALPAAEVSKLLDHCGVPHGLVQTLDEVAEHEVVTAREMVRDVEVDGTTVRLPGVVVKLSRTPGDVRSAPPALGQHTDAVLADVCGLEPEAIARLRRAGAI